MAEGIVIGNLTIPVIKGDKGDKGNTGEIISISLVLLSPSSTAYAINNGSTTQAQIELGIPKGLSVSTTNINASGELVFTFNDNSTVNVGKVVGKGISEVTVTDDFDFVVTYTDGTSVTACNLEDEVLGTINDILESYYTKTEIDNKGFITKEVNNLTNYTLKTSTGSSIELSINSSTYVMTLNLKNSAGTVISTGTVDLPLETMVVGATYDNTNKKIVLTLKNGSTIDVPVADLVSGLQSEITNANKLSADLVDDTNHTNKFVTASEKEQITTNATDISNIKDGTSIDSFGDVETALSGKEDKSNKVTTLSSSSTDTQYPGAKTVYDNFVTRDEEIEKLQTENAQLLADHPDITDTGTDLILNGTGDLEMSVDVGGNSTQETTSTSEGDEYDSPSPEYKQDINNVEGNVVVKGSSKNLFDKNDVTLGAYLKAGGALEIDANSFYTDYIDVSKYIDITFSGLDITETNRRIIFYDKNKTLTDYFATRNRTINVPSANASDNTKVPYYMRISADINYLNTLQVELSTQATSYVPFGENTVTFPLSQGQKLMLGDTLEDDGIHHKRGQIVLTGTENIAIGNSGLSTQYFKITISNKAKYIADTIPNALCNYNIAVANSTRYFGDGKFTISTSGDLTICDTIHTSASDFASYLAGLYSNNTPVIVEYELETETIEPYTQAQETAYNKLKEMQSYYDLTHVTGSSDNAQPILTVQAKKSIKTIGSGDLTDYVKNTDYATSSTGGVIKTASASATDISSGVLQASTKTYSDYTSGQNTMFIGKGTLENVITGKGLTNVAHTNSNNNFSTAQTINGTLTVVGDISQTGTTYETHAEQLYTAKDIIKTRDGAVGGLGNNEVTGIEAIKYDGTNNGRLIFDNTGTAKVGDVGDEVPLLARDESTNMTNNYVMTWDSTNLIAKTSFGVVTLTQAQYDALVSSGTVDSNTYYYIVEE